MKKYLIICTLGLLVTSCTMSRRVTSLEVPELPAPDSEPIDLKAYEENYGKFDGIYLYIDHTIEHTGGKESMGMLFDSWIYYQVSKYKWVVFNPENPRMTTFSVALNPSSMYAFVHAPDGTTRKYGKGDLKKQRNEYGYKENVLIFPDIQRGSVIEVGYEYHRSVKAFPPPLEHEFPLQHYVPCESLSVTYAYPDWWEVQRKNIGWSLESPVVEILDENNHKRVMKCTRKNIPALVSEPYAPYYKENTDYLQFMVTDFEMIGLKRKMPTTWTETVEDFKDIFLKKAQKNQDKVKEYANQLTNKGMTLREKIEAIVVHVRDNFDLNDDLKEGDYSKVIKDSAGSIIDLIGLTNELLIHAGVNSDIILVASAEDGYFDEYYVNLGQLSEIAIRVLVDTTYRLVFPQEKLLPVLYVPERLQGQRALIVSGSSTDFFWNVPYYDDQEKSIIEYYELTLNEEGYITVKEVKEFGGGYAEFYRQVLKLLKVEEQKAEVEKLMTYNDGKVSLTSYSIENLEQVNGPLSIQTEYIIDNLITLTPEEALFKTGGLLSPISLKKSRIEKSERTNPIVVRTSEHHEKKIKINYPHNWVLNTDLTNSETRNGFGQLTIDYSNEENALSVHQNLLLARTAKPKTDIGDFLALTGSDTKLTLPTLIFSIEQ